MNEINFLEFEFLSILRKLVPPIITEKIAYLRNSRTLFLRNLDFLSFLKNGIH